MIVKCVSDELLRWHFRQAVLANVKGAGDPIVEFDFPPGTDIYRSIHSDNRYFYGEQVGREQTVMSTSMTSKNSYSEYPHQSFVGLLSYAPNFRFQELGMDHGPPFSVGGALD
ncbi:hypothetical protein I7I48_05721 [Histoplasma ohiense]|nr:hypothetical protein I7I48_05721 [Histoplasma ohiense (nom. inval.)]